MLSKDRILVRPWRTEIEYKNKSGEVTRSEVAYGVDRTNITLLNKLRVNPLSPQMQRISLLELVEFEDRRDWGKSSSPVFQEVPDTITHKGRMSIREIISMFIP